MKVSLITACYNSAKTIETAMESVLAQKGVDIEYIIVDGGSKDGTVDIIKEFASRSVRPASPGCLVIKWISEPDRGMYDAINKGIKMATGDIVGILNADDVLSSDDTLAHIAAHFEECQTVENRSDLISTVSNNKRIDALYADIRFVKEGESVAALREAPTVRYCSAKRWRPWMFRFAAMVPHPSFYVRRECFERLGGYSLDYRICADFELELRYLYLAKLKAVYLPECVVVMRMGGMSTSGWRSNLVINREDLRALRAHGIWSCMPLIYLTYLFKVWGFVFRG